jgi:type I restriction enzyme M protein
MDDKEEYALLHECLSELEKESDTKSHIKNLESDLSKKVIAKYRTLSTDEIQTLVINDKWIATIADRITNEINTISQSLTQRIRELGDRYDRPLSAIQSQVDEYEIKVQEHLKKMGFSF